MKKKAIFLLFVLTGIIPIACVCPEDPSGPYLLHLNQVIPVSETYFARPLVEGKIYRISPNETYTEDTLILELYFDYQFAQNTPDFNLHASALALSCPQYPNYEQLKDKITAITVTSNVAFDDVLPGEPLNSKVVAFEEEFNAPLPLGQAITRINSISGNEFMMSGLGIFALTEKPAVAQERTFTISVAYESGKVDVMESFPIIW